MTTPALKPTAIMPMGDSITEADPGYRGFLYDLLIAAGHKVEFVGTNKGDDKYPATHHEGHSGFTIGPGDSYADILTPLRGNLHDNIEAWMKLQPDIILLLIGTNDYWNIGDRQPGYDPEKEGPARLGVVLDKIHAASPKTKVLVSTVLPIESNPHHAAAFNAALPALCATRPYATFSDIGKDAGFVAGDFYDGVHPSEQGHERLAKTWFRALTPLLGSVS